MEKKLRQLQFDRDAMGCAVTKFSKTGPILQNKRLKDLHSVAEMVARRHGGRFLYDITYSGDTSFETLTGTEICSHAVYVHPCNYTVRDRQIEEASQDVTAVDTLSRLKDVKDLDKYRLVRQPFAKHNDTVVFLPGSNLFDLMTDFDKLDEIVSQGGVIKPHPVTNHDVLTFQKRRWGSAVLNHKASGFDILSKCSRIYTTGSSEMAIYAVMLGKEVLSVERFQEERNPAYRPIFNTILRSTDPYTSLNNMFSSPKSGIFFLWDGADKIDSYLEYSKGLVEEISDVT